MGEFIKEVLFYILGVGLDGGKGNGWKGKLFVWPFVLILLILIGLIISIFI